MTNRETINTLDLVSRLLGESKEAKGIKIGFAKLIESKNNNFDFRSFRHKPYVGKIMKPD